MSFANQLSPGAQAPCYGQTEDSVKEWMKANVVLGATVVVRHTQGGFLHYAQAKVVRLARGRFDVDTLGSGHLSPAGKSFYYSGKNCWHPQGQTRLVIPTPDVLAACGDVLDHGRPYAATTV